MNAPFVREVEGLLEIEWPDPQPRDFPISAELFEQLVGQENERRRLDAAMSAIWRVADGAGGLNGSGGYQHALRVVAEIARVVRLVESLNDSPIGAISARSVKYWVSGNTQEADENLARRADQ